MYIQYIYKVYPFCFPVIHGFEFIYLPTSYTVLVVLSTEAVSVSLSSPVCACTRRMLQMWRCSFLN